MPNASLESMNRTDFGIADIDGNDWVDVGDALLFLADYGMPCE